MPDSSPRVPFDLDDTIDPALVTSRAGVPLVIERFRQLGMAQAIDAHVTVKQRQRGDVDATRVGSHKDAATVAYDGTRGYQPVGVGGAEQDAIVHDEFRDGHVPAGCGHVRVLELRADSALYETAVLRWCESPGIEYAISAKLSEQLVQLALMLAVRQRIAALAPA